MVFDDFPITVYFLQYVSRAHVARSVPHQGWLLGMHEFPRVPNRDTVEFEEWPWCGHVHCRSVMLDDV